MRALSISAASLPRWRTEGVRISFAGGAVGALMAVALALRLVWVFYTDTIPLGGDPHWYYVVGINLAQGFGFVADRNEVWEVAGPGEPTAFWPPGYPFALAALFKVFGVSWTAAQVMNAVLGALTVPVVYALGARMVHRGAGLAAAALFAVFPNVIAGTPLLFPEPLFGLIFAGALLLLVSSDDAPERRWLPAAAFGALAGLAVLTRGQGAVLLPAAALYWYLRSGWRASLRGSAIAALAAIALIAPWTVRNAVELRAFIPVSTNSAAALRVGHNEDSTGSTKWTDDEIDGFRMWESIYRPEWEVRGYREYTRRAIGYAITHPVDEVRLSGLKVYHLYRSDAEVIPWLTTLGATPIEPAGLENALWRVFDYGYYALLFGAIASLPLFIRRRPELLLLPATIAVWTAFHIVFLGEPRYHVPLYPLYFIAVAAGGWAAFEFLHGHVKRMRRAPPEP